ncbi:hypothetical protein SAMN02910274_03303 [Bacteroides sp. AR29]|nr:hypothetical protein SAMN02910274_03303 [Bacteroides sp. AR29]
MNSFQRSTMNIMKIYLFLHNVELAKNQGFYRAFSKTVSYLKLYNFFSFSKGYFLKMSWT